MLGPTLFALYTNDLPNSVSSGTVFMYAGDTTVYCLGDTVDSAVTSLNRALSELNRWCQESSLTPHSAKCEAVLLMRRPYIGPLNSVIIGEDQIEWVKHTRLLGVTFDDRLSWSQHLTDVKKSFVNKLNLLKRSSVLSRDALLDLYFQVFLPSVLYGLVVWGGSVNMEQLKSLEKFHRRAAGVIYNLPRGMPSADVYRHSKWKTLNYLHKLRLIKLFYKVFSSEAPAALSYLVNKPCAAYDFRRSNNVSVPCFDSCFFKNSISHRGAILWNAVSTYFTGSQFTAFYRNVKKDKYVKDFDLSAQSVRSLPGQYHDFKCY